MTAGAKRASDFVSEGRLWDLLMATARFGATPGGGVNRQALSAEDAAAKNSVLRWAAERGHAAFQDPIGNLFVRRDGWEPDLAPVMTGSHLDSQPAGGKFDGAFGVIAALEVLAALDEGKIATRRPVEVVAWTNEEGSRFLPGAMGSSVFAGIRDLAAMARVTDTAGTPLGEALAATLAAVPAPLRDFAAIRPHAYVEAHIEQGPILEDEDLTVGVVTAIQGIRNLVVEIRGEEAHAGTTPRRSRRDAFSATVAIVAALEELTRDEADILRFTVGRCEVFPGSPNSVAGRVRFTINLRHPDDAVLRRIGDRIGDVAQSKAGPCEASVTDISYVAPTRFAPLVVDLVRQAAVALGYPHRDMLSGAGHDAMHLSRICPAGMVFVPCHRGISHNEAESATPAHLAAGTRVLADTVVALAGA